MKHKQAASKTLATLEDQAADFIIPWEGFRSRAYSDIRQWSIGFGTWIANITDPKPLVVWTREQARKALNSRLNKDLVTLREKIKVAVTAKQWIALLSFSYNLGIGRGFMIATMMNQGKTKQEIATTMRKYYYANGQPDATLKRRRQAEAKLFES